ncbi:MAG: lysophospholipid acyltransferase family protein [Cyclobacteriaceae bacterium]
MIQWIWFRGLRLYVKTGLHFYFKSIEVCGRENVPDGPVIFTPNHQNAFMDALVLICHSDKEVHSMVRASVFNQPFLAWLLGTLNMMPVFRIRDGYQSLGRNEAVFDNCYDLLTGGKSLLIFPEGNHDLHRRVPPLSKGFTRIAFGAMEASNWQTDLYIVPVGLNYSQHTKAGSRVRMTYCSPIALKDYKEAYAESPAKAAQKLRELTAIRMGQSLVQIPEPYQETERKLIASRGDNIVATKPTNEAIAKIVAGEQLEYENNSIGILARILSSIGLIFNIIPISLMRWIVARYIPDIMFHASLKIAIGIFLFPMIYGLEYLVLSQFTVYAGIIVLLISPLGILLYNKLRRH